MPSSTSKQISYPCPIIGNSGDYIESAKVNWGHFVERFPKKVIFHFRINYILRIVLGYYSF